MFRSSGGPATSRKNPLRNWMLLGFIVLINLMLFSVLLSPSSSAPKDYSAFEADVVGGQVATIVNADSTLTVTLHNGDSYTTVSDTPQDGEWSTIEGWLKSAGVDTKSWPTYANKPPADSSWILSLLTFVLPMVFLVFILFYFLRSAQGANNAALGFGKSRAKLYLQGGKTSVTFADVAGVDEAKVELQEVVEFLKYPEKFSSLGARIPRGVLLVGPPGTGKCIVGDSLILTDRGLMKIADVANKYAVDKQTNKVFGARLASFDLTKAKAVNATASHWYDLGIQPTLRIRLNRGLEIEGTPEHPVLVMTDKGRLGFRRLDEMHVGDQVAILSDTQRFGNRRDVDEATAYIMGLLTGDGCLTIQHRFAFSSADEELVQVFRDWVERYLDGARIKKNSRPYDYWVQGWEHKKALLDTGLTTMPSWLKEVPASILEAPKELQSAFLRGLFDSDGYVEIKGSAVALASSSPVLSRQVVAMLLNFGITPTIRRKAPRSQNGPGRPASVISISGDDLVPFAAQVNFNLTRKKVVLDEILRQRDDQYNPHILGLPFIDPFVETVWRRLSQANHSNVGLAQLAAHTRNRHRITRQSLRKVLDACREHGVVGEDVDQLELIANSDLTFSSVKGIAEGENRVYDFTVPGTSSFISNGMISHNTLMAKAVAGEAGVPFFSISGSEFVEMFVGVGASRARDVFDQAKRNAPAIIFLDELDAVGRQRGTGLGGSHDEREQTLNQILVEMDGFDTSTNVIVIAATNRPDVLDPALLRPGRFDRQVILDRPDLRGRIAILKIHLRGKPIDKSVDIESLARQTPGFSGADLANLANEAAILAARRNRKVIMPDDFSESVERVSVGPQRASRIISDAEKRIIAIHEGGHAVVQRILPKCDPVHKVTIISRGMALGYTSALPTEDRYLQSKSEFEDKIAGLLAGNAAERLMFGDTTTGASSDIEKATTLARKMVTEWGMSERLGPLVFGRRDEAVFLGRELGEQRNYSDEIAYIIDEEVGALIKGGYARATGVLTDNKMRLMRLADKLIAQETVEGVEFESFFADLPPKEPLHAMSPVTLAPDTEIVEHRAN